MECGRGTRSRTGILRSEAPDAIHYTIPPWKINRLSCLLRQIRLFIENNGIEIDSDDNPSRTTVVACFFLRCIQPILSQLINVKLILRRLQYLPALDSNNIRYWTVHAHRHGVRRISSTMGRNGFCCLSPSRPHGPARTQSNSHYEKT